jgi:glycosyltransferase involved in cell wall biosynthesis
MQKIFVLNNYSFQRVWQEVNEALKPNHHLYGVNYLEKAGYEMVLVPFDERQQHITSRFSRFWRKTKLPIPLGDLFQQFYVLKHAKKNDLVYAPCQTQTQFLSYLRALGLFNCKVVVVAHHPPIRGRYKAIRNWFFRMELRGTDAYPSLSDKIATKINTFLAHKSKALHWGPDMAFYQPYEKQTLGNYFLAAGRTGRDFATFAHACSKSAVPAKIICLKNDATRHLQPFIGQPNIEVIANDAEQDYLYDQLTPIMAAARAICIPLFEAKSHLAGLTSLTDALALGKPILMTRNDFIDIDIEKEGIGFWVDANHVEGWVNAIAQLKDDDLCISMGKKAKALGENTWNIERFSKEILALLN